MKSRTEPHSHSDSVELVHRQHIRAHRGAEPVELVHRQHIATRAVDGAVAS